MTITMEEMIAGGPATLAMVHVQLQENFNQLQIQYRCAYKNVLALREVVEFLDLQEQVATNTAIAEALDATLRDLEKQKAPYLMELREAEQAAVMLRVHANLAYDALIAFEVENNINTI
jgi:predicted RNA-binding Zn ribbon-like protein